MVFRIMVFLPIKTTRNNRRKSFLPTVPSYQHAHGVKHEFFAFDVNQHYRRQRRKLSDIHPSIAKKIERFKVALREEVFSMFPKKLRIAEHI